MLPYLSLFGRLMPTYGVLGMAGLGFGLLAALLRCKRFGLSRDDCAYLYILGAVGALVGAKLLYLLPLLPRLAVELYRFQLPDQAANVRLQWGRDLYQMNADTPETEEKEN